MQETPAEGIIGTAGGVLGEVKSWLVAMFGSGLLGLAWLGNYMRVVGEVKEEVGEGYSLMV